MRRSPKVTEVSRCCICVACRPGTSPPALAGFLGTDAGLSASTISRLTETWQTEHAQWETRDLSDRDYVYWWADGVHFNVPPRGRPAVLLVIVGVRPDGSKELVALADGYREDTESWLDLLRSLKTPAWPVLASPLATEPSGSGGRYATCSPPPPSSGAGFTRPPTCSVPPQTAPPRSQDSYRRDLQRRDPSRSDRRRPSLRRCLRRAPRKPPRRSPASSTPCWRSTDYPHQHWIHLRTTNPIESTFSTVRLRTRVTRGAGSRQAALAMLTSSSTPPKTGGERSTHLTSSQPSEPAPSSSTATTKKRTTTTNNPITERTSQPELRIRYPQLLTILPSLFRRICRSRWSRLLAADQFTAVRATA